MPHLRRIGIFPAGRLIAWLDEPLGVIHALHYTSAVPVFLSGEEKRGDKLDGMPLRRPASPSPPARAASWQPPAGAALLLLLTLCSATVAPAQHIGKHAGGATTKTQPDPVPVLMLSDIHFEPFQDPVKLAQLRDAPIEQWPAIFDTPASPTQAADFQALQKTCPVRGVDTSWSLLSTSLAQSAAVQSQPLFVTVSGDLLSHNFDCRYKALTPKSTGEDFSAFAAKTVAFVTAQLRRTFPNAPIYLTLGNNDSGCADYREDRNSPFLRQTAEAFAAAARTGVNGQAILREFSDEGDYNVALPAPMRNAHLLVLQDMFESPHYEPCGGKHGKSEASVATAQAAQLAWLQAQLAQARARHQHVWVMAHVPPGIDMYNTLAGKRNICAGQAPVMYLGSEELTDVLTGFADVLKLAIFAHSHADEMRYLHAAGATAGIPVKLVSSISPVNGNQPTFTVAEVAPDTGELLDDTVFLVGDGVATKEYSFAETYKFSSYSAGALQSLTGSFLADTDGSSLASRAYQRLYFPGDTGLHAAAMLLFWHTYACSLRENQPDAFRACACPAAPDPAK